MVLNITQEMQIYRGAHSLLSISGILYKILHASGRPIAQKLEINRPQKASKPMV